MDVVTLYSSIPHSDGIKACKIFMIENGFASMEISNIIKIMDFILTHNYFEFNDKILHSISWNGNGEKIPPQHCKEIPNVMKKDAKYAI